MTQKEFSCFGFLKNNKKRNPSDLLLTKEREKPPNLTTAFLDTVHPLNLLHMPFILIQENARTMNRKKITTQLKKPPTPCPPPKTILR